MRITTPKLSILLVVLAASGCQEDGLVDLARAADDATANRMIVQLPGFEVVSVVGKESGKTYFQLRVPKARYYAALARLDRLGLLPRARPDHLAMIPKGHFNGFTQGAEAVGIDFVRALAAEDALCQLVSVRDARVVVTSPVEHAAPEGKTTRRHAAVVVVHDGSGEEEKLVSTARQIVAGAVDGLTAVEDDIFVDVTIERTLPPSADIGERAELPSVAMAAPDSSASDAEPTSFLGEFKATIVAGGVSLLLLLQTVWILRNRRRGPSRSRPVATPPTPAPAP